MRIDHVGLEVVDLFTVERFYRQVLGFELRYRYLSRNTAGLRTVFLARDGVALELLERPRPAGFLEARPSPPHHLALEVDDVDAWHRRLLAVGLPALDLTPPRTTGDGYRELVLKDPEGNVVELAARVGPEPRQPVRAVIFDLDGTLVDSEENYFLADEQLLAGFGVPFTREDKRRYIGGGNLDMMVDLVRRYRLPTSAAALAERKNALYLQIAQREGATPVFPAMRRFLSLVQAGGLPVALATGSSPEVISRLLAATGLAGAFPVAVSAEEVARGKPRPDVFLEAARRLGVAAEHCLVVEDSAFGVEAARRAFMRCLAVPFLVDQPLDGVFRLADRLVEGGMPDFDPEAAWRWVEGLRG